MKEIEDDTNSWKDMPCCWTGRINIIKMTILPKAINRVSAIPIKIQWQGFFFFFAEVEENNFKTCMETHRRPQIPKTILRKKKRTGGIMLPDFRLYYKAILTKTVWY